MRALLKFRDEWLFFSQVTGGRIDFWEPNELFAGKLSTIHQEMCIWVHQNDRHVFVKVQPMAAVMLYAVEVHLYYFLIYLFVCFFCYFFIRTQMNVRLPILQI